MADEPAGLDPDQASALRDAGREWAGIPRANTFLPGSGLNPDLDRGEHETLGAPGSRYVRVRRANRVGFEKVAPGWIQATARVGTPTTSFGRIRLRARRTILGTPLATRDSVHERLTKVKALAVLSSDALSSVAYATEQIGAVFVLAGAGAASLRYDLPIMGAILFLLVAVVLSYRQTIRAYPNGGGSYIVAKDNLGTTAGLIAASALMTDYVLTVAVSVSSGVAQLTSAVPRLIDVTVPLCVGMIILIVLGNLRGIRESGSIFAAPTYLFIVAMLSMIAINGYKYATGACAHHACAIQAEAGHALRGMPNPLPFLGLWLVLQAFASGCSALTGVEAISDGVPAFKPPEWRNARTTLTVMGALLGTMFIGITWGADLMGIYADDPRHTATYQALISKLAHVAAGDVPGATFGIYYYFIMASTTAILVLAANTAFSDFPRLFFFLARDNNAPHQFRRLGDRLAFSNGILVLAALAILLVVVFKGDVSRLIPLYAIGVFLAFTMSQAGMVKRWLTRREPGWRFALPFNLVGAVMTSVVFMVEAATKFMDGAFVIVLLIPTLVMIFRAINRHYSSVKTHVATEIPTSPRDLKPLCIVPIANLNQIALQSLAMARAMSDDVIAVHVCDDEEHIARLRLAWDSWGNHVPLEIIESPYRSMIRPLLVYIDEIDRQRAGDTVVIVLPEMVATRRWHNLLHNQTALRLKAAFLFRPGTVVVSVPYHLQRSLRGRHRHARDNGPDDDSL